MLYTVDVNSNLMNEFKKEVRENGEYLSDKYKDTG